VRKIKRGHIESARNYMEFFTKLHEDLETQMYRSDAIERKDKHISQLKEEIKRLKKENEELFQNLLDKSNYIYNIKKQLSE